jgi:hypothetical protein
LRSGYEFTLQGPTRILVELQWAMAQRFYAIDVDLEAMLKRASVLEVSGRTIRILAPNDLLLVLSVHTAKHMFERLSWLVDIAALISTAPLDWREVSRKSKQYGLRRILAAALTAAAAISAISLPAEAALVREDLKAGALTNALVANAFCGGALYPPRTIGYFAMYARLRESGRDRLRIATRLALTPGPGEWSMVKLPGALFPLYILVRVLRLIRRGFRALLRMGHF